MDKKQAELIRKIFTEAADTFVQKNDEGYTEIWAASSDWFLEEWGRDTFISLPGTLLVTGRFEEAKSVFRHFADCERGGLIPNRIQKDKTLYNTVDASMWYIQALKSYIDYTDDWEFVEELLLTLRSIIEGYRNGTSYEREGKTFQIFMDADGLIVSPPQATWMDADPSGVGDEIVTPRNGKAVEINALWYSNLLWMQEVVGEMIETGDEWDSWAEELGELAEIVKKSFNAKFWNDDENCLLDVVEGDPHSGAVRPNQLIAISKGGDLLSVSQKQGILDVVTQDLLTPFGLRTLSPRDSHYIGEYETTAPMAVKDLAYHQGTVWPWPLGPYCDALSILGRESGVEDDLVRGNLLKIVSPLVNFCLSSEIKSLPEVFAGDADQEGRHKPGGTRSQAWSVAEIFRILHEHKLLEL